MVFGPEEPGATPTLAIESAAAVASGEETEDDGEESLPDLTPVGVAWTGSHDLVVIGADDAPAACLLAMPLFVRLVVRAASRDPAAVTELLRTTSVVGATGSGAPYR